MLLRAEAERTGVAVFQSHQTRERCRKLRITPLTYRAGHEEAETCGDASQLQLQLPYLIPNLQETCRSRRQSMLVLILSFRPHACQSGWTVPDSVTRTGLQAAYHYIAKTTQRICDLDIIAASSSRRASYKLMCAATVNPTVTLPA